MGTYREQGEARDGETREAFGEKRVFCQEGEVRICEEKRAQIVGKETQCQESLIDNIYL